MIELIQKLIASGSAVKVASALEGLIRQGRVEADAVLPPVRELATAIGVSPGTAASAYKLLRQRGVVSTDGRRGTRVMPQRSTLEYGEATVPAGSLDLMVANPDPALLPDLHPIFSAIDARSDSYGGRHIDETLRKAMANSFEGDGIDAKNMMVTTGAIAALYRALKVSASPGDKIAVEDPGFTDHHACVRAHAMVAVPVSIDDEGLQPASLELALRAGAKAVIVSPRFQSPTGAVVTARRATELRKVLAPYPDVAVLIDDYAFLLAGEAYAHCVDSKHRRWLVVRHLNKALAPDLRVAVAACDAETADRLKREQWLSDGWVSAYLQRAAGAALSNKTIRAQVKHAGQVYAERRRGLLSALHDLDVEARGVSGMNVWVPVKDETFAVSSLLMQHFCVRAGSNYRIRSPAGIRVTTARLEARHVAQVARAIRAVVSGSGRGP